MHAGNRLIRLLTVIALAGLLISAAGYVQSGRLVGPFWRPTSPTAVPAEPPMVMAASAPATEPPAAEEPAPESPVASPPAIEQVPGPVQARVKLSRIPVLMYHEIGNALNNNYVRQGDFAAQMDWLADNGYTGVTLAAVYRHLFEGAPLPPKPVAITFDDGYRTFYSIAVPILQQHRFAATNFVITGFVGRAEHMTWEQVVALPQMGMEVGSHTVNHLDLRRLSADRLKREVEESRRLLEEWTGVPVESFCYPSGQYDDAAVAAVRAAGYKMAVTTASGPATPEESPLLLSRIRVSRLDSLAVFVAKVQGAAGY